ncbi:efflux RND transporter periplasmic adaptor subunit [Methylomarinum sp. Ch1-1]|uniref:Efflux RND transporter periplasmic adaptor subunit n=1 Tax=Methylomarinum roseum TaxID=3067653 RepID=A0AAU7NZR7_9GAMM|nr:efflux RND transporter periplasmic adaptor subunit [Methylomarinum sp. Ch1-1]MDP4521353.1 efflux RND transporter periplasmic adaptor subunit [Methylomarinum sp. Ch1-1]
MKKSVWMALIAMAVVSLWLVSGRFVDRQKIASKNNTTAKPLMSVAVSESKAKRIKHEITVQGQLEPDRKIALRAETAGLVEKLWVDKGERVDAGQVVLKLQEKDRLAQIAKARAEIASQQLLVKAMLRLRKQGLQAETNLKQAQADLAAAEAELLRLKLDLADTEIKAPFAGVLETRDVELGSYVDIGDTVADIVDIARLKAVAYVSQQNIKHLKLGQTVRIRMLDGSEVNAGLSFIAKEADAATRSFRIEAEFDNADFLLSAGGSAELHIRVGDLQAHFLSPAVLTLDEDGRLGVKTMDDDNRVHFKPVQRIRSESAGIWVSGLPEQALIIGRGQGFVLPGETVKPMAESAQLVNDGDD